MKKLIYSFIFIFFMFDANSFAALTVISDDDEKTKTVKGSKSYLSQTWEGKTFELEQNLTFGTKKLMKVDAEKYEKYLREVDLRILNKIGDYKVYIIGSTLKDYKTFRGLSFKNNTAVIFATYYNMSDKGIANLAIHELGHNVDFQLMNSDLWREYKKIRKITNEKIYNNTSSVYENRPQEIFAEDFRILYGGEDAKEGEHLNKKLESPSNNKELISFFEKLIAG